jgi:hypothetical protein
VVGDVAAVSIIPNPFQCFADGIGRATYNLASDSLFVALTNTKPDAINNKTLADIAQIAAGGGYSAGGNPAPRLSYAAGVLMLSNVTFAATAALPTFQYAVLYDATPAAKPLIAFFDNGFPVSLLASDTFTVAFDQTNGALVVGP